MFRFEFEDVLVLVKALSDVASIESLSLIISSRGDGVGCCDSAD